MSLRVFAITVLCFVSRALNAQSEVDSLWRAVEKTDDPIAQVDLLNDIAFALRSSNPDSTLLVGRQSEKIAIQANYQLGIGDAKLRMAIAHTNMGNYYRALQLCLESKSIFEEFESKERIAGCLNNIGRLYNFIGDHPRALDYYQQSAVLFSELKDKREGNNLNNIGYIYKLEGDYPIALSYLRRAWNIAEEVEDSRSALYPIYNIGSTFVLMDELDSAAIYLDSAAQLSKLQRNQYILSLTRTDQGKMFAKQKQTEKAETALREAYEVASSAGMRSESRDAALLLSSVYEEQGNLKKALEFQKIFQTTSDSLFNRDLARRMGLQEAEYEYQRLQVQQEIKQEREKVIQEKELARAIWTRNSLIVGLVAMSAFLYLLYRNYKRNRQANEELRELNRKIEKQTVELQEANHEIIVMNNNLEQIVNKRTAELKLRNKQLQEYLSSNSHIVRAPLARILGLVDLYDPEDSANLPFINESLQESATELDNALRSINEKLSEDNQN